MRGDELVKHHLIASLRTSVAREGSRVKRETTNSYRLYNYVATLSTLRNSRHSVITSLISPQLYFVLHQTQGNIFRSLPEEVCNKVDSVCEQG